MKGKNAKAQVQEEAEFLRTVYQSVKHPIFAIDVLPDGDFRYVGWNAAAETVSGIKSQDIIGKTPEEIYGVAAGTFERQQLQKSLASGEATSYEECLIFQGKKSWWMTTHNPVKDSNGKIFRFIGTSIDIGDRRQLEAEMRLQQTRLNSFFQASNAGLVILDEQLRYLHINQALAELNGVPVADCIGKSIREVLPELAPTLAPMFQKILDTGIPVLDYELVGETPKHPGVIRYWLASYYPLMGEDGRVFGIGGVVIEISDRKRAEFELQQKEAQYRSIFEAVTDGILINDIEEVGRFVAVNPAACKMFGYYEEELLRLHPSDYVHADSLHLFEDYIETIKSGKNFYCQAVDIHKDGRLIDVEVRGSHCLYNGKPHALAVVRDISEQQATLRERKAAAAELKKSQQQIANILASITDAFFSLDREWNFTYLNDRAEELLFRQREELLGKNIWEVFPQAVGTTFERNYQQAMTKQVTVRFEEFYPPLDSWYEVQAYPFEDGLSVYFNNISDRKAADVALREYADRQMLLNQLINQIRNSLDFESVVATTIQSIQNLLKIDFCGFAWYNPEDEPPVWTMIQEAKRDKIPSGLGSYPASIVGPIEQLLLNQKILQVDDAEQHEEPIHRAFLRSIECKSELLLPVQTHSQRIGIIICVHHSQVRPWRDSEVTLLKSVSNQLAIAIDQAELYAESRAKSETLKQTLQELQRTQAHMVQAEKMSSLGVLVAGIAHEINNPVNFIHGNVTHTEAYTKDLLELIALYQQAYPNPTEAIADKIEDIDLDFIATDLPKSLASMQVGTERIREIVKSLRLFSRLDEAEVKSVDIHDGIDSTLTLLQTRIKAQCDRHEIQIIKDYENLPLVECFAGQLNQVFMNILSNAIDALEERDCKRSLDDQKQHPSTIRITTEMTGKEQVSIRIFDNGIGIPEDVKHRIFDPFFTTKPVGKGTGMGMSISYQIVTEKHGGKLSCHSIPGQGTEFAIEIPIKNSIFSDSSNLPTVAQKLDVRQS